LRWARINRHCNVKSAGHSRSYLRHQWADSGSAPLKEVLIRLHVKDHRTYTGYLAHLGNNAGFTVDVETARHSPGMKFQAILLQRHDPFAHVGHTVDRHARLVVKFAHPIAAIAGLDEHLANGRRIMANRLCKLIDAQFTDSAALVIPDTDLVVIRRNNCHRKCPFVVSQIPRIVILALAVVRSKMISPLTLLVEIGDLSIAMKQ
jgi:hypothetical protein